MANTLDKSSSDKLDCYKYLPRFKSIETEQEFHSSFLQQDKFLAQLIVFGTILVSHASIIPDTLSGTSSESIKTLYLTTFLYCTFSVIMLKILSTVHKYRQLDLIATVWWGGVIIVAAISASLYQADLKIHVAFDVLFPAAIYLLIPLGLLS